MLFRSGDLYVADGYGNARVHKFSKDGRLLFSWGEPGRGPGQFIIPHGIGVDSAGLVYVADRGNNRIQIFKEDGTYVTQWVYDPETKWPGSTWDLAIPETDPDYLVFIDGTNNKLNVVRRSDGKVVHSYGRTGHYAGEFIYGHAIAIDHQGNVYTGEVAGGQRVQKWLRQ